MPSGWRIGTPRTLDSSVLRAKRENAVTQVSDLFRLDPKLVEVVGPDSRNLAQAVMASVLDASSHSGGG